MGKYVYRVWYRQARLYLRKMKHLLTDAGLPSQEGLIYTAAAAASPSLAMPDVLMAPLKPGHPSAPTSRLSRAVSGNRSVSSCRRGRPGQDDKAGLIQREAKPGAGQAPLVVHKGLVAVGTGDGEPFWEAFHLLCEISAYPVSARGQLWQRFDQVVVSMDAVKPVQSAGDGPGTR